MCFDKGDGTILPSHLHILALSCQVCVRQRGPFSKLYLSISLTIIPNQLANTVRAARPPLTHEQSGSPFSCERVCKATPV